MKQQLLITIAAVVLVGCASTQLSESPTVKAPDISIHRAAEQGNIEAVKQHLAAGTDVNENDGIQTPLHYANSKEIAKLLIANGADVNAKDKTGSPPLYWAVRKGRKEIAQLLIEAGADVSVKKKRGKNLLHRAASGGRTEIAQLLIANGLDVNAKDANGSTPLYETGLFGHTEIANLLIEKGADINEKTKLGLTTLHYAAINGHKKLTLLLIEKGADINAKTDVGTMINPLQQSNGGDTPLDAAVLKNKYEIADLLRKHGAKTGEELKAERKLFRYSICLKTIKYI